MAGCTVQTGPVLRNFILPEILKKRKKKNNTFETLAELFLAGMKSQLDEGGRRTRAAGGHAAASEVPVSWSLGFNWAPLYIRIYIVDSMYVQSRLGQNST